MCFKLLFIQDRVMISITCMLIISTIQSSIDKMVPKTSYFKMVDIFLLYSFNIVIVIMGIHTYMDMCINRDEVTGRIVDKESSRPSSNIFITLTSKGRAVPSSVFSYYITKKNVVSVFQFIFEKFRLNSED